MQGKSAHKHGHKLPNLSFSWVAIIKPYSLPVTKAHYVKITIITYYTVAVHHLYIDCTCMYVGMCVCVPDTLRFSIMSPLSICVQVLINDMTNRGGKVVRGRVEIK